MKNCPVCKEQIPEDAKFCPVCGIKLPEEAVIEENNSEVDAEPALEAVDAEPALEAVEAEPALVLGTDELQPEIVTEESQSELGELQPETVTEESQSELGELQPDQAETATEPEGGFFTYTSNTSALNPASSPETSEPYEYAQNPNEDTQADANEDTQPDANEGLHADINDNDSDYSRTTENVSYEPKKPMSSMDYARQTYGSLHQTEENPYEGPTGNPNVEILNAKKGENTINSTPYLVCSILATILSALSCCGIPFGIVAIVYAAQIDGKLRDGKYEEAKKAADNSKIFAIIAAATFVVIYGFIIFSIVFGAIMW